MSFDCASVVLMSCTFAYLKAAPCRRPPNEWHAMEKTTRPWTVVSLKGTMGTMGRDPPISENIFFEDPRGHSSGSWLPILMILSSSRSWLHVFNWFFIKNIRLIYIYIYIFFSKKAVFVFVRMDHTRSPMAIGDRVWPFEIAYRHRRSPMAIGDRPWP